MGPKYRLTTLGCKVNQYESQQIRELLESLGLRLARNGEPADVAVVNTCAVTASALAKSRQAIRRLAREDAAPIFVVGCGASAGAQRLRAIKGIAAILGHDTDILARLRGLILRCLEGTSSERMGDTDHAPKAGKRPRGDRKNEVWMSPVASPHTKRQCGSQPADGLTPIIAPAVADVKNRPTLTGSISRFEGHQRAFLKVQDGCDALCTYCVIPRLRPRLRSKALEAAVAEARALVRAGHTEIVVTGVFLGAYGRDTAVRRRFAEPDSPLARLVAALAAVPGLERLRLSSLEPGDVDASLLEVIAANRNCVPHLHLPLQSGSDGILARMNRQYTRDQYVATIERTRAAIDRPAITTDVLVGFPGETERDFLASLDVIRFAGFCKIHSFPFSPRPHTPAAHWRQQFVPSPVVKERMRRLADLERECSLAYRRRLLGEIERVIVERTAAEGTTGGGIDDRPGARDDGGSTCCSGRTDRYFPVHFRAAGLDLGDLVSVRIDRVTASMTHGTYVKTNDGLCRPSSFSST
jgi:threonylcarbamoyladenosine tRNA methylthiotransferase MtaB